MSPKLCNPKGEFSLVSIKMIFKPVQSSDCRPLVQMMDGRHKFHTYILSSYSEFQSLQQEVGLQILDKTEEGTGGFSTAERFGRKILNNLLHKYVEERLLRKLRFQIFRSKA